MKATCDLCGKFIAEKDFEVGRAKVRLIAVDSDYSIEEHEMICSRCLEKEKNYWKCGICNSTNELKDINCWCCYT